MWPWGGTHRHSRPGQRSDECPPLHSWPSKFTLQFLKDTPRSGPEELCVAGTDPQGPPSELQPFLAPMVSNQRVTGPSHFQDVRLIEFDISDSGIRCGPAPGACGVRATRGSHGPGWSRSSPNAGACRAESRDDSWGGGTHPPRGRRPPWSPASFLCGFPEPPASSPRRRAPPQALGVPPPQLFSWRCGADPAREHSQPRPAVLPGAGPGPRAALHAAAPGAG